mmetsp:Transcript_25015/g.22112  ORF Transcript_25015/g.22112 Transcript_25015/m.22112 type:complete len:264 (+) Transcript_25015:1033-1824(+)
MVDCLVYGSIEVFDTALQTYEYILYHTDPKIIQRYVMKLVGPLIRVAFYKYETELKAKVVENLMIFEKVGVSLGVYMPQLQTTFLKMINDSAGNLKYLKTVSQGLNFCANHSAKRDFMLNDLFNKFFDQETSERELAYIYTIYNILKKNADKFSKAIVDRGEKRLAGYKEFELGEKKNKYICRVSGFLINNNAPTKQKEIVSNLLNRMGAPSDKDYPVLGKLIATLIFCDSKLIEEIGTDKLIKSITTFMLALKVTNNVLFVL